MNIPFPEDEHTAFKQGWCPEAQQAMIAFANGSGGVICFGVAEDGEVLGCDHDGVRRAVMSFARKGVEPTLLGLVRTRALRIDGRPVTVAHILPGAQIPYGLRGKVLDQGGVFIRLGGETVAATLDEVFELIRRGDRRRWETRPAASQSLTFTSAKPVMASAGLRFDQESLLDENRLFINLAALLSDQNRAAVRLNIFRSDGTLELSETESGSVLRQMIRLRRRLEDINPPFIEKNTSSQTRHWPPAAPWEALTCAMAHRDYGSDAGLSVNVFPKSLSFLAPGGLPSKATLEEALLPGWSSCRNPRLLELFGRLGWMAKGGSGLAGIFRAYAGFGQKPLVSQVGQTFMIELPRIVLRPSAGSREDVVLGWLSEKPDGLTRLDIEKRLELSRSTVQNLLKKLEQAGRILRERENRKTRYRLNVPSRQAAESS